MALYRAKDYDAAIAALGKSASLHTWGDYSDRLYLAMALWQTGKQEEARRWEKEAIAWMEKKMPKDPRFLQLRSEAQQLKGQKPQPGKNDKAGRRVEPPSR